MEDWGFLLRTVEIAIQTGGGSGDWKSYSVIKADVSASMAVENQQMRKHTQNL